MAGKGSKYARKRLVEAPVKRQSPLPYHDSATLNVIYDDITFLDTFADLNPHEQVQVYQILKQLSDTPLKNRTKEERQLIKESVYKLDRINEWSGLKKEEMLRHPLSQDEHHILRMDCYGTIDRRPMHKLSSYYRTFCNKKLSAPISEDHYKLEDPLSAPAWQIFRQFRNFRKIEGRLKNFLSAKRYDPKMLSVMSVQDFSDLIFQTFKTSKNALKVSFVDGDSERNSFVKAMASEHGKEIKEILKAQQWDERLIDSLLNAMAKYSNTNTRKVIVPEKYFTKQILSDLKNAKIPTTEYHVGDEIPQTLIDELAEADKLKLVAMRDEDGSPVHGEDLFEVHHKVAISESGKLPSLPTANYRSNYVLLPVDLHRSVLHIFDKIVIMGNKEAYRCRLEFKDPNISFMGGFSKKYQFDVDWSQDPAYQKRVEEDREYLVGYDAMMALLSVNRSTLNTHRRSFNVDEAVAQVWQQYPEALLMKQKKTSRTS